jgi:hypothetical protein
MQGKLIVNTKYTYDHLSIRRVSTRHLTATQCVSQIYWSSEFCISDHKFFHDFKKFGRKLNRLKGKTGKVIRIQAWTGP